ncbi:MAG: AAA family ATPase [Spirochaetia bacterium]|nr:AAA family ATPase [Spirochaetia bacterium]
MFLKSVEIFGFKSFADRSKLEFTDGISALLGPNGCGKSNIVDSIKWVLGEQATKMLRAERMEDIIFNGTENRKPLNVAEVTLTMSNDEGVLPIDISEIAIKRRLHRSGESEYFINNTPAKLKEIRELFFDTGIGKTSYSIMEQGKIDQILSNKPEERRYIFEEAAGITKFKQKGAEAERKLEKTEANMRQVEGILGEVKRSYDNLKKQSEKTADFRKYREEIFNLELDIHLLKLKDFLEIQNNKEEKLQEKSEQRDELKKKIDTMNDSLETNLDLVNSMESKLIENQKKLYGIDIEKNNRSSQIAILNERVEELKRQIETERVRENSIETKIKQHEQLITEKKENLADFINRQKELESNILSFQKNIETADKKIKENETEVSSVESEIVNFEEENLLLQDKLRELTDDIVRQLDASLKDAGYSYELRKKTENSIDNAIESLNIKLKEKILLLEDALSLNSSGKKEINEIFTSVISALKDSSVSVLELEELISGYRETIPSFLDEFLAPEGIITRKREIEENQEEIREAILKRRERSVLLREENKNLILKIEDYRKTLSDLRVNQARVNTQKAGIEDLIISLNKELAELQGQLKEAAVEIAGNLEKIKSIESNIKKLDQELKDFEKEEKSLQKELSKLENGITSKNKDLISKEGSLKKQMELLGKIQSQVEQLQIEVSSVSTEVKNIYSNFKEIHSRDLSEFDSRVFEIKNTAKDLKVSLSSVKIKLKDLGHVNLMAPEEFIEVKERYDFLTGQLDDLYKAREDLTTITKQIKIESTELFLETYDKIKKNFHVMFRRLFGGGRGELKLTDPDNVLTSGIDIFAQPPGKKLENIALLSGGERSLTAVGMLFATYLVKPSPFCILDEIDAALDEANVNRFVNLLMEFGERSQFIVITHNKKTVTGAKTLLGVTMEESGVSKMVAMRLEADKKSNNLAAD